jgi:hypothetical protein
VTALGSRLAHADPDVEVVLAALESAGLLIVMHLVPVCGDKEAGWFFIHCPRGCHDSVSIPNRVLTALVRQEFYAWVGRTLAAHDRADMEGAE